MNDVPDLVLLLGGGLAFVVVVALWKFLVTAGVIAFVQWAIVTNLPDQPALQAIAFAVPALLAAITLRGALLSARPVSRRMSGVSYAHRREYVR